MFGLKKWMDNIVVRTKKTKSKSSSKQNQSCCVMGKDVSFASPTLMRRSEISPLQNTNGGRAGWKTPDSPGKRPTVQGDFTTTISGDDRHRYKYRSDEVKKIIIARPRPQQQASKKDSTTVVESKHNSVISEFGSVSSPESAYGTGYSTSSYDLGCPAAVEAAATKITPAINCPTPISYDSPSPRQRSRIRTNPWYKNQTIGNSGNSLMPNFGAVAPFTSNTTAKRAPPSVTSSPSFQDRRPRSNCSSPSISRQTYQSNNGCDFKFNMLNNISPISLRKRKLFETPTATPNHIKYVDVNVNINTNPVVAAAGSFDSLNDDDSTLKEMGKFCEDFSYTYDKETDILSDSSEQTQCQGDEVDDADFDTGQEAEDEYEEEIEFIDKHAVSITESVKQRNSGSCVYYVVDEEGRRTPVQVQQEKQQQQVPQPSSQQSQQQQVSRASLKLRKRLRRTRKRSECSSNSSSIVLYGNGGIGSVQRECRSVGGTPLLNRRGAGGAGGGGKGGTNQQKEPQKRNEINTSDRCISLTTLSSPQKTLMTIAESEKQLLKSDLEAFQLISELITQAETLLGSFKGPMAVESSSYQQQQQQQQQQRNVPPHLPNKRVEMLRAEVSKRPTTTSDVLGNHSQNHQNVKPAPTVSHVKPHSPLPVNKKIALLKQEQYAFGPPPSQHQQQPQQQREQKVAASKENYPPRLFLPPPPLSPIPSSCRAVPLTSVCPSSEPLKRKVYVPSKDSIHYHRELFLRGGDCTNKALKNEMILKTLEDLKRSLEDQKTQLYTLNEKN